MFAIISLFSLYLISSLFLFLSSCVTVGVMLRLDSVAVEKGSKSVVYIEGCKAVSLIPSGNPYNCLKSEEVKVSDICIFIYL